MKQGTVCFFLRDYKIMLVRICYPDGVERWNGVGGDVDKGETPEEATTREIQEEIGVKVEKENLLKEYEFNARGYHVIVFTVRKWKGEPLASEPSLKEVKWFAFDDVPYGQMWEGNDKWLPKILKR